jgi:hypothetical protein
MYIRHTKNFLRGVQCDKDHQSTHGIKEACRLVYFSNSSPCLRWAGDRILSAGGIDVNIGMHHPQLVISSAS